MARTATRSRSTGARNLPVAQGPQARYLPTTTRRAGPSPALTKAKAQAEAVQKRYNDFRRKVRESQVPSAVMGTGAAIGAAAACGIAAGAGYESVAGVPVRIIVGGALAVAGIATETPLAIQAAAGPLSSYAHDYVAVAFEEYRNS